MIIASLAFLAATIWALLLFCLDFIFLPNYVVPEIKTYVRHYNQQGPLRLSLGKISFQPLRGFVIDKISVTGRQKQPILLAESAEIDISILPLLWRRIEIAALTVNNADLNILRDTRGDWNVQPLFDLGLMQEGGEPGYDVVIKKFRANDTTISFADRYRPGDQLSRIFSPVDLRLTYAGDRSYRLQLFASDRQGEEIDLDLSFDLKQAAGKGEIKLKTPRLADYWHYYLDEVFKPWKLDAKQLTARSQVVFSRDDLDIYGHYELRSANLQYGDISFRGNAVIDQDKKSARISLTDIAGYFGKLRCFKQGRCRAEASPRGVEITELLLRNGELAADLKGRMVRQPQLTLELFGKIDQADHRIVLSLLPANQAQLTWQATDEADHIDLIANIYDLSQLAFVAQVSGEVNFSGERKSLHLDLGQPHAGVSLEAKENDMKGQLTFGSWLKGKLREPDTWLGWVALRFEDFTFIGLPPRDFDLLLKAESGVFSANIPPTEFYRGRLKGRVLAGLNRWGVGLDIENCDIATLGKTDKRLAGMKGSLTTRFACVGKWLGTDSLNGGGYFKLADSDLRSAALFRTAEEGIAKYVKDFKMPSFKKIEGDFQLNGGKFIIENAYCEANNLNLNVVGNISFSGQADLTIGVRLFKHGWFNTFRRIVFPITMGLDMIADSIKIRVKGQLPNVSQSTEVQPMAWFQKLLEKSESFDPDRYSLEQFWNSPE